MTGKVGNADPSLGYIMWFANVVELYQKRNCNCFACSSPDHLMKDCLEKMGKTTREVGLNLKEVMVKKGGWSSHKSVVMQEATLGNAPKHKIPQNVPFLNPDPLIYCSQPENIAWVKIDD